MRATAIGQSPLLMLDIIDILNKLKLPYAIIGAMAVSYYGVARSSLDADAIIFADVNEDTKKKLRSILKKKKLSAVTRTGSPEDPLKGLMMIEDRYGNHVDLIFGIQGMDHGAPRRIKRAEFEGVRINMIGIEDLIATKIFAGGSKDLADAEGILEVSKELIDKKRLVQITKGYGERAVDTLNELLR